jgi:F420-dependent oxidoreductase-like protein
MELGIFSTAVNDGTLDDIVAEAALVESDGFAAFWVPNIFGHDALTALALVGREVPRIELGTAVVPTFPRHPHAIAQQAHTVAAASGNRFTLGIGLSHKIVIENMFGLSYDKPIRHLREYLSVLMPLSRNEFANFEGEMYKVHAGLSAKGSDGFSVVVAALGEQMLRVTAAMTDGTLTWCTGPVTLANHIVPTINKAADEFGRPAPRVIAALPVCVTADTAGASARAAETFAAYGGLPSYRAMLDREGVAGPADIAIIGSAAEVQDRVGALAGIGVTDFAAVEFGATPDEIANTRAALKGLLNSRG